MPETRKALRADTNMLAGLIGIVLAISISIESVAAKPSNMSPHRDVISAIAAEMETDTNTDTYFTPSSLTKGVYLPESDIYAPSTNGINIFKELAPVCYAFASMRETEDIRYLYKDISEYYRTISADSGIALSIASKVTMGMTLSIKSSSMSSGLVEVSGTSIDVHTYVKSGVVNKLCFKDADLTDEFLHDFDSLPDVVESPWLDQSWEPYETFLKVYGSHLIEKIFYGASARQWTFSKKTEHLTDKMLKVKACVDFTHFKIDLKSCVNVTKEEAEKYEHLYVSNHLDILGGSDATRNAFRQERSEDLLYKLLMEGRHMPEPVRYMYTPIWDILLMRFDNDKRRYNLAMTLRQFYHGYKDFGCTLQEAGGVKLRHFAYQFQNITEHPPIFQCVLINRGCHSDDDCHIGGAGTVTYCYGASCYDYADPKFGCKAKNVVARTSKEGSYSSGINWSCHYKAAFRARCSFNYFGPAVIWDGASGFMEKSVF